MYDKSEIKDVWKVKNRKILLNFIINIFQSKNDTLQFNIFFN